MRVLRFIGYTILITVAAGAGLWYFNPFAPPVTIADSGETGRRVTDDGLFANYYPAAGKGKHAAILILGGSEGGLANSVVRAAKALQAEGYSVLQLAYFGAPGQSDSLQMVPLELFDRALDWLKARGEVDAERIAIMGGSKGAEAALIVAARRPELRAVVAGMPSSVAWQGVDPNFMNYIVDPPGGSWSLDGKPIPYLPYVQEYSPNLLALYSNSLAQLPNHQDAIIPIEKSKAAVLLICGKDDQLWPACTMAEQVRARAAAHGGPAVTVLAYDDAGHAVYGVPVEKTNPRYNALDSVGGTDDGNNAARIDGWPKILEHLKAALGPQTQGPAQ